MGNWASRLLPIIVSIAIFVALSSDQEASAISVESVGSGDWNVGATWDGGVVPSAGDDITIKSPHVVTKTTIVVVVYTASITIEAGAELKITGLAAGNSVRLVTSGTMTNNGIITITGADGNNSGRLVTSGTLINTATITITSDGGNRNGRLTNSGTLTNTGTITATGGTGPNSGQIVNQVTGTISNSDTITLIAGAGGNSGQLTNSGTTTNSGTITGTVTGNPVIEITTSEEKSGGSGPHEPPTIGKNLKGTKQQVDDGICIDFTCWTVTMNYHQEFELYEMLSGTHTISTTVYCNNGVEKCNYVALAINPYNSDIRSAVWKVSIQKDHLGEWVLSVDDPEGYLGEITYSVQIINDKFLQVSFTIDFKHKDIPPMQLAVELRDIKHGLRVFYFNDGVQFKDSHAYPYVETKFEPPLEIEPLCLNEDSTYRHSCAFAKVREWTIGNAEQAMQDIMPINNIYRIQQDYENFQLIEMSQDDSKFSQTPIDGEQSCYYGNTINRYSCNFDLIKEWAIKNAEITMQEIMQQNTFYNNNE